MDLSVFKLYLIKCYIIKWVVASALIIVSLKPQFKISGRKKAKGTKPGSNKLVYSSFSPKNFWETVLC